MKHEPPSLLGQLMQLLRPFRKDYLIALSYSILSKFCELIPELILGLAVNTVVKRDASWLAKFGLVDLSIQFITLGVMTFVIYGIQSTFQYLYCIKWWFFNQTVQHSLRLKIFSRIQNTPMSEFYKQKAGNIMSIINEDVTQIGHFFEDSIEMIINLFASTVFISIYFFTVSAKIALLSMIPIPIIVLIIAKLYKVISPLYADIRRKAGALSVRTTNGILGFFSIKSLVAESIEQNNLTIDSENFKQASRKAQRITALIGPIVRIAIIFGFLSTIIYGGILTINDKIDVGSYSTIIFLSQRILWPFTDLAEIMVDCQKLMASTKRVLQLLHLPEEKSSKEAITLKGSVTFENVSFQYEDKDDSILNNISFSIETNQSVAFVGSTGSGKSTLVRLLLGMHNVSSGSIKFDNIPIDHISFSSIRSQIGLVSQDTFLFEGTIAQNIAYAFPIATKENIVAAAKQAAIHDFIMSLPDKYETWVTERGYALSGGQKQRIAIARAIIRNPRILILDEATSALDNETEMAIQTTIQDLSTQCTKITIAHRLSTVRNVDIIYVLEKGSIIESGNHTSLLKKNGVYSNLWKLQAH
jgi:ATP-binding cassette subfamily B protein